MIPQKDKCSDADAYDTYGDTWYDGKLALRYCASLTVPKGQCVQLDLDDTGLVQRAGFPVPGGSIPGRQAGLHRLVRSGRRAARAPGTLLAAMLMPTPEVQTNTPKVC